MKSAGIGSYYLRKALELGDIDLLKEVLSPFLSEKPVKTQKIKATEVISEKGLLTPLLHPVPGKLLLKAAENENPEMLNVFMSAIDNAVKDPELKHRVYRSAVCLLEEKDDAANIARFCKNGYKPDAFDLDSAFFQSYSPNAFQTYIDNGAVSRSNDTDLARIWSAGSCRFNLNAEERGKVLKEFISHGMNIKNEAILYSLLQPEYNYSNDTLKDLIKAGAPIVTDSSILNPMHLALDNSHAETAKILVENTPAEGLKATDLDGTTLLMKAASFRYSQSIPLIDMLVEKGADVNATDRRGQSALMYVSDKKTAEALIKMGANVFHKDHKGRSVIDVLESRARRSHYGRTLSEVAAYIKEYAKNNQQKMVASVQKNGSRE